MLPWPFHTSVESKSNQCPALPCQSFNQPTSVEQSWEGLAPPPHKCEATSHPRLWPPHKCEETLKLPGPLPTHSQPGMWPRKPACLLSLSPSPLPLSTACPALSSSALFSSWSWWGWLTVTGTAVEGDIFTLLLTFLTRLVRCCCCCCFMNCSSCKRRFKRPTHPNNLDWSYLDIENK